MNFSTSAQVAAFGRHVVSYGMGVVKALAATHIATPDQAPPTSSASLPPIARAPSSPRPGADGRMSPELHRQPRPIPKKEKSATMASSRSAAQPARAGRSADRAQRAGAPLARARKRNHIGQRGHCQCCGIWRSLSMTPLLAALARVCSPMLRPVTRFFTSGTKSRISDGRKVSS